MKMQNLCRFWVTDQKGTLHFTRSTHSGITRRSNIRVGDTTHDDCGVWTLLSSAEAAVVKTIIRRIDFEMFLQPSC